MDVACQTFLLSSCIAWSFHTKEKLFYPYSPLWEGIGYIYIYIFQESLSSCIALSIHGFGCMLHAKLFFYRPALLCHSILLGKTTLPLFTPLGGDWFYIYIFQESLLSSFIALSIHTFGRGCMLHPKLFFYHPALLCHSILLGKDYSTLNHSCGKELFSYIYNLFQESLLSSLFSIIPS